METSLKKIDTPVNRPRKRGRPFKGGVSRWRHGHTRPLKPFRGGLKKLLFLVLALCLCFPPAPALAQEARLTNIVVTNTRDDLLLYLSLEGCFTPEMEQAILNGVPTSFSIFVELSRVRTLWMDKEISDITATHTIKYDTMKKEFTVTRSERPGPALVTHSFVEAKKAMAEVDSLKVAPLSSLEKGRMYQVQTKAMLEKTTLPLYLHYVLFFVSMWDFETDWYTISFYY